LTGNTNSCGANASNIIKCQPIDELGSVLLEFIHSAKFTFSLTVDTPRHVFKEGETVCSTT